MNCYLGIDGGGSTLRAALVDQDGTLLAESGAGPANPRLIGFEVASAAIQALIHEVCQQASIEPSQISAAGIGIAGAPADRNGDWLQATLQAVLPDAHLALSSDFAIALVGALGQREGLLILAGTGSAAYGHAPDGRSVQIGGWGYILGDAGSGYWLGLQALKLLTRQVDAQQHWQFEADSFSAALMQKLKAHSREDLLRWVYGPPPATVHTVAALARLVIDHAAAGDSDAAALVDSAAQALTALLHELQAVLGTTDLPIAFAGGLLSEDNMLSQALCRQLNLAERPVMRHSPVVGAAVLARLELEDSLP